MKIVGIAYHSPLDVMTLAPNQVKVTTSPNERADIMFSQDVQPECKADVMMVFASPRLLVSKEIKIIDQGSRGQILNLARSLNWKNILES